jgi:hypothetical protein
MSARTWIAPADTASLSRLRYSCRRSLEALAFWIAVLFPVIYLPLMIAAAIGVIHPLLVFAVVAAHAFALVVGHRYTSETGLRA